MKHRSATLLTLLAAIALAGCESTEQESAKIAKRLGHQRASAAIVQIKGTNSNVRVVSAQIVSSASGSAAVLELSNSTIGESSPSGELSLLEAHETAWWVDSSVLASGGTPVRVVAKIGAPTASAPPPTLSAGKLASGSNFVGPFVSGSASNSSGAAAADVTVYAVALAGSRVVAAGQGLIPSLGAHGSAPFQVNVVGKIKGATPAATLAPARVG
jgi:hypothetical protein